MKRGWKILIVLAAIFMAAVLGAIIHHYQLSAATNTYIAKLKALGEPMDLAQVLPAHVPPEENSADTVRQVAALFHADQSMLATNSYSVMKMVAPGKAMICSRQSEAYGYNATNSWEEVSAALAKNKAAFVLLQSLIEKPKFDFDINYERGMLDIDFTNLCLAQSKKAVLCLQVALLSDLHKGNTASSVKDLRATLAFVKGMSEERLAISELVRIAIANMGMAATWEILQSTNVTDEQLAALQSDWAGLDFIRSEEHALEMERASGAVSQKKWRESNSSLAHYFDMGRSIPWADVPEPTSLDRIRLTCRIVRWRYWWSYPDELLMLKGYQALLSAPRAAETNYALLPAQNEMFSELPIIPETPDEFIGFSDPMKVDLHFLLSSSIRTLSGIFKRVLNAEASKQLTVAAIGLKRYHLKHNEYPPNLAALTPEYLPEIPRDPVDGQPLRYRPNSDGTFLLYSIGDDGKDDGGNPTPPEEHKSSLQWQFGRDWGWPQPATADEIKKFYDNPPK